MMPLSPAELAAMYASMGAAPAAPPSPADLSPPVPVDPTPAAIPEPNIYRDAAAPLMEEILGKSRTNADRLRAGSAIARGADTINAAISGTKPGPSAAGDFLANEADTTEKRGVADVQMADLSRKLREQRELKDPSSPASRRAQDALLSTGFGKALGEATVRRMSAADVEKSLGMGKLQMDADQLKATQDQRGIDNKYKTDQLTEEHRHNVAMENKPGAYAGAQAGIGERYAGTALGDYAKRAEAAGQVVAVLHEIDDMAPGMVFGKVPPGELALSNWDKVKRELPQGMGMQFTDAHKAKLMSAIGALNQYFKQPIAGANFTDQERHDILNITQDALGSPPEVQAAALDLIRSLTARALVQKAAAARVKLKATKQDDLWNDYASFGGLDPYSDPLLALKSTPHPQTGSTAAPAPNAAPQKTAPKPGDILTIGGKKYRVLADGKSTEPVP
jgi:hypothetical protein